MAKQKTESRQTATPDAPVREAEGRIYVLKPIEGGRAAGAVYNMEGIFGGRNKLVTGEMFDPNDLCSDVWTLIQQMAKKPPQERGWELVEA